MRGQGLLSIAVIFVTFLSVSHAKTVVLYPFPTTSYIIYHGNIASALTSLGHEVWLCVPHYLVEKNLVKDKAVKIVVYGEHLGDITATLYEETKMIENFWAGKDSVGLSQIMKASTLMSKMSADFLSDQSFFEKIKSLKPDLFVLDCMPFNLGMIIIPYKLDIPYALIGAMHNVVMTRVPFSPADFPLTIAATSNKMTFLQRLQTTLLCLATMSFEIFYDSSLVARFAPEKPYVSIAELVLRAEIFLAELDHILDYPRPTLPNTKLTGGSSASPAKPLVGEFKKFVEESKHGVIVASFGGSVVDVPFYITSKMSSAFKQLDLRVVWRVNISSTEPNQIMTSKWIPQNDLLGHNKTKLFISHCGKNGQYEALYHGVPILCLPIFGDQHYNAERIFVKGFGQKADMRAVSADELAGLMKEVIYEPKYTDNIKKASRLFRELYKVPMKEVAYWLDHVMTYGGSYMRSAGQEMPLYQFLILDVIAFIAGILIFVIVFVYCVIKMCCKLYRRRNVVIKAKKE